MLEFILKGGLPHESNLSLQAQKIMMLKHVSWEHQCLLILETFIVEVGATKCVNNDLKSGFRTQALSKAHTVSWDCSSRTRPLLTRTSGPWTSAAAWRRSSSAPTRSSFRPRRKDLMESKPDARWRFVANEKRSLWLKKRLRKKSLHRLPWDLNPWRLFIAAAPSLW